jgi:lipopolysaccharide export system protein LptA
VPRRLGLAVLLTLAVAPASAGQDARSGARVPATPKTAERQGGQDDALRGLFVGGGQRGPINIDARRFEADNRKRTVSYSDQVVVRQNDTTLTADKLTVAYDEGRRISQVTAEGGVRIVQKAQPAAAGEGPTEREAQCARVVFQVAEERITCTGQPATIRQGDDVMRGARIVVLVGEERITVEGDGASRVSSVITPRGDALDGGRPSPRREGGNPGQAGAQAGGARPE